ncbi:outer membrane protein assembly factor BamD [Marinomonas balearica]|uniref:Outer membrane protein assembly factor BamD n=1 Tax=Marinomonas balearica TaxID=491947 RepID=A0A4R6M5E2_9GAMM|nr:outer membrane protein assembly factor BamD [Marinomonas balearica]TDO96464.1 Beta-barrel assembly machine subunit BamD [Marinomonas balearica]
MGFLRTLPRMLVIVTFYSVLSACSNQTVREPDLPEREYYDKAQEALDSGLPATAVKHLKDLTSRYPFGDYSTRAELDLIYAQYESGDYIASHATAKRFIHNHLDSDALDYAYYMRGLSTYKGAETFFGRYLDLNPAERDAHEFEKAFGEFAELLARFPASPYAVDAKARMIYLRNTVADHELQVAHYYFKRHASISALRRAQEVIQYYPSSMSVEEAIAVTIQAYLNMEQYELGQTNLAVLKKNYPDSQYVDSDGKFIPFELPKDADPDFLYWVSLGIID